MVGVASSNLVAPTKFGRKIKHLAAMPGAFFLPLVMVEVADWLNNDLPLAFIRRSAPSVRLVAREPLPFENFAPRKDEMSDHKGPTRDVSRHRDGVSCWVFPGQRLYLCLTGPMSIRPSLGSSLASQALKLPPCLGAAAVRPDSALSPGRL